MRFVTFESGGKPTVGVRLGDEVVDLSKADASLPESVLELIEAGDGAFKAAQKAAEGASERLALTAFLSARLFRGRPK